MAVKPRECESVVGEDRWLFEPGPVSRVTHARMVDKLKDVPPSPRKRFDGRERGERESWVVSGAWPADKQGDSAADTAHSCEDASGGEKGPAVIPSKLHWVWKDGVSEW